MLVGNDTVFTFGGLGVKGPINELNSFNTSTYDPLFFCNSLSAKRMWTPVTAPGPGPRFAHTACTIGKIMYVYGGTDGSKRLSELWAFDTGNISNHFTYSQSQLQLSGPKCLLQDVSHPLYLAMRQL